MDWANEEYVRVYKRDTADDLALPWEARALWNEMLRKFDRAGVIEARRKTRSLAGLVHMPVEVVERVLPDLLADGRVQETATGYFAPNFLEAQEARKGDKLRQRESRERRRDEQRLSIEANIDVTNRDSSSQIVTEHHARSHDVTRGHAESHDVTLCSADPLLCDAESSLSRAIPPSTVQATSTVPVPQPVPDSGAAKANHDAWEYARRRFSELGELSPEDKPRPGVWTALPTGEGGQQLVNRTRELIAKFPGPDWNAISDAHRNVVDCNVERARMLGHRGYLVPTRVYEPVSFARYVELTPGQVRAIEGARSRGTSSRAGPEPVRREKPRVIPILDARKRDQENP